MRNVLFSIFGKEIRALFSFVRINYSEFIIISLTALFLIIDSYHPLGTSWVSTTIYFAILPMLTIMFVLRRNPLDFGLRLGNFRIWGFHVVITLIIGLPILYLASHNSSLESYYTIEEFDPFIYSLETIVYIFSWEFIFRGFLLFGLKDKLMESSILIQMIPFALLHLGKPELETLSTILMGIYLGYVAYRGNSYWPAFIIHLFINISFPVFVNVL